MAKKIIGFIMVIATIVVIVFVALRSSEYKSLFSKPTNTEVSIDENLQQQVPDSITVYPSDSLEINIPTNQ